MKLWAKIVVGWAIALAGATAARAQGARFDDIALRSTATGLAAAAGATITVCTSAGTGTPCTPLVPTTPVTLCTDATCTTAATNPFTADGLGNFGFWALPGTYKVTITGPGLTGYTKTVVLSITLSGNNAFTGNNTHSGTETFSGAANLNAGGALGGTFTGIPTLSGAPIIDTLTVGKQNNVRFVDGMKFTTIAAAIADLPATGGIVFSNIPETFTSNPFAGLSSSKSAVIYLGRGTWTTDVQIVLPSKSQLIAAGRGDATAHGSVIKASASFPVSTPIVRLGAGTVAADGTGTRIENVTVDCSSISGSTGIYSTSIQEQSGIEKVMILNCPTKGIFIDGTGTGAAQNYYIRDVEIYHGSAGGASTVGIDILGIGDEFGPQEIKNITANGQVGNVINSSLRINGIWTGSFENIHGEHTTNVVMVGNATAVKNVGLGNIYGLSNVTNGVQISAATTSTNLRLENINSAGGTNSILDSMNSVTITESPVALYAFGSGTTYSVVTTANGIFSRSNAGFIATVFEGIRFKASKANALVAGDFALSAGWGTTATVSAVAANSRDQDFEISITSSGTGQAANPTITFTFKDGTFTNAPALVCQRNDTLATAGRFAQTTLSATAPVLTFVGTPVATEVYKMACSFIGN